MKIKNLETVCVCLASSRMDGATAALREVLDDYQDREFNEDIYQNMALFLVNSIECDCNGELSLESVSKIKLLIELVPKLNLDVTKMIEPLLGFESTEVNVFMMVLCHESKMQEEARKYLLDNMVRFSSNEVLLNMVLQFREFDYAVIKDYAKKLSLLEDRLKKQTIDLDWFYASRDNYFRLIYKILNKVVVDDDFIDLEFLKNVFSLTDGEKKKDIQDLLISRKLISNDIDFVSFYQYLIDNSDFYFLNNFVENGFRLSIENWSQVSRFYDFVHYLVQEEKYTKKCSSLLYDLVDDISKNGILAVCYPEDSIEVCNVTRDVNESDQSVAFKVDAVLTQSKKFDDLREHYYEDFLLYLLQNNIDEIYSGVIISMLMEQSLDLSYCPVNEFGSETMEYWIATLVPDEALPIFINRHNIPSIIYGQSMKIPTSALCFRAGMIPKGVHYFEKTSLMGIEEETSISGLNRYEISYDEAFNYQDILTQIVKAIYKNEKFDSDIKRRLLHTIIAHKNIRYINIDIFNMIKDLYSNEEMLKLLDDVNDKTFISYRTDDDVCYDYIKALEVSSLEEIESLRKSLLGKSYSKVLNS